MSERTGNLLTGLSALLIFMFASILTTVTVVMVIQSMRQVKESEGTTSAHREQAGVVVQPTSMPPTVMVAESTQSAEVDVSTALQAAHAAGAPQTGKEIFEFRCSPCHGIGGVGSPIAPAFTDRPIITLDFVMRRVRSGPEIMSAFTEEEVSDEQIALIVDYLENEIVGTDLPVYTEAEMARARELYLTYCTECHGALGFGKQDVGPAINLWPPMSISRIVNGGLLPLPNMPRLTVTPEELRMIAAYVQSLGMKK